MKKINIEKLKNTNKILKDKYSIYKFGNTKQKQVDEYFKEKLK